MSETTDTTTIDEAPPRRLVRVDEGRWLGGVAAGLGRYFDVNPLIYRIAFAALALAGGTGLLLYLAAYLVIPSEHDDDSIAVEALRGQREHPWLLVGVGLLAFGALFGLSEARFWPGTGNIWLAATLLGGALVWWHVSNRQRPPRAEPTVASPAAEPARSVPATPRPPKRPSLFAPVLGALLAAAGFFGLLAVLDIYDVDVAVALAAGVAIVGVAIAVGAMTQRRVGGLVLLGLLLLAAFGAAAMTPVSVSSGLGDKTEQPMSVTELQPKYELGMGSLNLDFSDLTLEQGTTSVEADVGIGELVVTVPPDVRVEIDAHAGIGDVNVLGSQDDGVAAQRTMSLPGTEPGAPILDLELDVGLGAVEVRRS